MRLSFRRAKVQPVGALTEFLREETTGGQLLLVATVVALLWANLAAGVYTKFWGVELGPEWLHLHLTLAEWVTDGLLAIFFFVAALEVKRELTIGELADWRAALLPLAAAAGGVLVPSLVNIVVSGGAAGEHGAWAVPVATDIAFALGILALAGSALPSGVRVLLLSMAVIDDVIAIMLIAALFTHDLQAGWLAAGLALCACYGLGQRRRAPGWLLVPVAAAAWVCVHASGVHATVTGIALGLLTSVRPRPGERESPAERLEHRLHPVSAGFVVPVFALAAAGIPLTAALDAVRDPVDHGIVAGLLIGKPLGIFGGAWLAVRLRLGELPGGIGWRDVVPVAMLGGIGYTVSLLIARLSLQEAAAERAAIAVLTGSLIASVIAVVLLRMRGRKHKQARMETQESAD